MLNEAPQLKYRMAELVNINVQIAGRPYPLKISEAETELVRTVEKEINDKIHAFQKTYVGVEKQDCLSMTLFTYAVDMQKLKATQPVPDATINPVPTTQQEAKFDPEFIEKIFQLDTFLDKVLNEFEK